MTIYIDADACPVTRIVEAIAKRHGIPVMLLCDTKNRKAGLQMLCEHAKNEKISELANYNAAGEKMA